MIRRRQLDADGRLVRRASIRVAATITVAVSVLVVGVLIAAYSVVFSQIPLSVLLNPQRQETAIDISGLDIVVYGTLIGGAAIIAAAALALLVTRRAVRPLVDTLRRQRQFVADASHELRTPLAVLDSRLQLLERSLQSDSIHRGTVAMLRDDSRALIAVVSDLLESLETDPTGDTGTSHVAEVTDAVVAAMQLLADQRQVHIQASSAAPSAVAALPTQALGRCITALLDNALKHSPEGGAVAISTEQVGSLIRVTVSDRGAGIQGIDPSRIFERFARSSTPAGGGGNSRSGFGIGLALVHDTVSRYGGEARVASTSAAGTAIELTVPAVRA